MRERRSNATVSGDHWARLDAGYFDAPDSLVSKKESESAQLKWWTQVPLRPFVIWDRQKSHMCGVVRSRPEIWFSALRAEGLKSLSYAESFLINLKSEKKGKYEANMR